MLDVLAYATVFALIIAVVLAVARDVPILEAIFRSPDRRWATWVVGVVWLGALALDRFGVTLGDVSPLLIGWPVALAYFAWCVVSNLRGGATIETSESDSVAHAAEETPTR